MKKILVIEDDPSLAVLYRILLSTNGYSYEVASNGLDGLEKVWNEEPDLVLLDRKLPDISGLQVLQVLQSDPRSNRIPVIMTSILPPEDAMPRGGSIQGVIEFHAKPFYVDHLMQHISRMLAAAEPQPQLIPA